MFQKLRIRLTLFNLIIIVTLLLLIAFGAFIGSPMNDPVAVNQSMLQVALTGELPEQKINNYRNKQGGLSRIQLNSSGDIENVTSALSFPDVDYPALVQQILKRSNNSGIIPWNGEYEFLYLRLILNPADGQVIVIQEVISTAESLQNFVFRISPALFLLLALVFAASLVMTQQALIPIKKAWQRQAQFTADASHELRTPLSVIQTNLECATDEPTETIGENMQWLDNIKSETQRMAKLVNDLLTLSRSDSSEHTIVKTKLNLSEVLQNTIEVMRSFAKQNHITLQYDMQPGLTMSGDKELIQRLAVILIENAIKYTTESGIVHISAECQEKDIIFKVTDTGIGIEAQHLENLFDRFYRVDTARSNSVEGSGLGLSLAKWIVQAHNGTITVESEVRKGTEFVVAFNQ